VKQLIENDFTWTASNRDGILGKWMDLFDGKSATK
jgi:hypothetical protein